jgi:hypothetical protein
VRGVGGHVARGNSQDTPSGPDVNRLTAHQARAGVTCATFTCCHVAGPAYTRGIAAVHLTGQQAELVAYALERLFRLAAHDGITVIDAEFRQVAALVAIAAAPTAIRFPALLRTIGPQAAAQVKVQAARAAASADDPSGTGGPLSGALPAAEAARTAGVSAQAIRAACASRRLTATKNRINGEWRITRPDLAEWMEGRRA